MAVLVGVAVTGAGAAGADAAQHRARIAADDAIALHGAELRRAGGGGELGGRLRRLAHEVPLWDKRGAGPPPPCGERPGVGGLPTFDGLPSPPPCPSPQSGEGTPNRSVLH